MQQKPVSLRIKIPKRKSVRRVILDEGGRSNWVELASVMLREGEGKREGQRGTGWGGNRRKDRELCRGTLVWEGFWGKWVKSKTRKSGEELREGLSVLKEGQVPQRHNHYSNKEKKVTQGNLRAPERLRLKCWYGSER